MLITSNPLSIFVKFSFNLISDGVDETKLPLQADDDKDYKVLRYEELIPYLVEAIKEQQVQIDELKTKLGE